ncbi:hypothetical protein B0F00_24555 [Salmonella enterica subsp. enterica serovar Virchow]|uniref:Uncharacterized protein n=1 Tax=Salmonella virchow TaxID=48409 RepID=A0A603A2V6_SALVI|nr:hypothetical protein [Salmonella enterica subsp. enterica serovar Virchow]
MGRPLMPQAQVTVPEISVRLFKSMTRKPGDKGLPVSERYAGKDPFIDITPYLGDGSSVSIEKAVTQTGGGFTITLSDRPNYQSEAVGPVAATTAIESVYGLVETMDAVEIRMWSGVGRKPDRLPVRMRGFVTSIRRTRRMGNDGKPVRQVIISGQDYAKILQSYQLLYTQSYPGAEPLLTGWALFEQFGEQAQNTMEGADLIQYLLDHAINPMLHKIIPENSPMPREIVLDAQAKGRVGSAFQDQEGSVDDLLRSLLDVGLWNELFIDDREDGVYLVWRPLPYFDLGTGEATQEMTKAPDTVTVPDDWIISFDQARDDHEVYNYLWVTNQQFDLVGDQYRKTEAMMSAERQSSELMTYPNTTPDFYGIRAMYANTVMSDSTYDKSGMDEAGQDAREGEMNDWIARRRLTLIEDNKDNVVMEHGSIQMKGGMARPDGSLIRGGDYIHALDGRLEWDAYAVTVSEQFVPYQMYLCTAQFIRGTGFAARVAITGGSSPWLTDQANRGERNR